MSKPWEEYKRKPKTEVKNTDKLENILFRFVRKSINTISESLTSEIESLRKEIEETKKKLNESKKVEIIESTPAKTPANTETYNPNKFFVPDVLGAGETPSPRGRENHVLSSDGYKYVWLDKNTLGGGTSNHAALTNLDYSSSGHTGFAGTQVSNLFTQPQTISGSLTVFPASGSNFALNIREWSATGSVYTEPSVLTLDDAHFDGTYANVSRLTYNTKVDDGILIINVSDASSNPNKYWVYNTLTNEFYSNQLMDTNWKDIPGGYGLRIRFDSVTGHGLNDRWNIRIKDIPALKIYKNDQRESTSYPILQFRNNGIVINNNPSGLLNPPFQNNVGIFVNEYADESNPWAHGIITQVSQKISSSVNFNTLGNYIRSQLIGGSTGTNTGFVLGQFTVAANYSATTASNVVAGQYACEFWGGSGVTTNAYVMSLRFAGINNNCTIYNGRGLYIEPLYHPRILNGTYAIYQEGSQDWNYFAGKVGIGITSPEDKLHVQGTTKIVGLTQVSGSIKIKDGVYTNTKVVDASMSPYSVSPSDYIILVDANSNQVDISLPDPVTIKGQNIIIKVINASNPVKINTTNGLIDGMTDISLGNPYSFIHIVSDGIDWYIISQYNV
jgi:hypothetical protein